MLVKQFTTETLAAVGLDVTRIDQVWPSLPGYHNRNLLWAGASLLDHTLLMHPSCYLVKHFITVRSQYNGLSCYKWIPGCLLVQLLYLDSVSVVMRQAQNHIPSMTNVAFSKDFERPVGTPGHRHEQCNASCKWSFLYQGCCPWPWSLVILEGPVLGPVLGLEPPVLFT